MKPTKGMIERAKKSLLGRFACRLVGDQKGAVMMEYVIVAVLIAAAAVVAVAFFGRTIQRQFSSAAAATAGQAGKAKTLSTEAKTEGSDKAETKGKEHNKSFSDQ